MIVHNQAMISKCWTRLVVVGLVRSTEGCLCIYMPVIDRPRPVDLLMQGKSTEDCGRVQRWRSSCYMTRI